MHVNDFCISVLNVLLGSLVSDCIVTTFGFSVLNVLLGPLVSEPVFRF